MLTTTLASLLTISSGVFSFHLWEATQTDHGLIAAAAITSAATVIAGICSIVNTYLLTRVRRRQEVIHRTAEEGAQSLIGMAHDAARHSETARRESDKPDV